MFFAYILRCSDNSLYCGFTTDIKRRFSEHQSKSKKGAKYTHTHNVVKIEALWEAETRSSAMKLEAYLKKLQKAEKEQLVLFPDLLYTKHKEITDENIYEYVVL